MFGEGYSCKIILSLIFSFLRSKESKLTRAWARTLVLDIKKRVMVSRIKTRLALVNLLKGVIAILPTYQRASCFCWYWPKAFWVVTMIPFRPPAIIKAFMVIVVCLERFNLLAFLQARCPKVLEKQKSQHTLTKNRKSGWL